MKKSFLLILLLMCNHNGFADSFYSIGHVNANENPFVRIHGLPGFSGVKTLPVGQLATQIDLQISNEFHGEASARERLFFDYERSQLNLGFSYGITEDVSIGLVLPYIWNRGGFMDSLIENWHDLFGFAQGGRDDAARDEFTISYRDGEQTLFLDESDQGVGDISVFLDKKLLESHRHKLKARANLKLPSGDEDQLFGSGGYSFSISLNGSTQWAEKWQAYGMVGLSYLEDSDVLTLLQTNFVATAVLGTAWHLRPNWTIAAQLDFNSEVYDESNLDAVNGQAGVLTVSTAYQFSDKASLLIGFNEDVISKDGAPDFGINLGFRYQH